MLRSGMLLGVGAAQGVMAGPLVAYSNLRDDTLVVRALVSTALVFGSFSMGALTARRRSMVCIIRGGRDRV